MILVLACSEPTLPEGAWRSGDLHVHSSVGSNDTDGLGAPEVLAAAMEAAGLDFVFLTDHSNAQGSMHCEDVEDCPNLGPELPEADWPEGAWPASEISPIASLEVTTEPRGHTGCLPLDGERFGELDHFVDRPPGEVTGGEALEQCVDNGGWAVLNHPFAAAGWVAYDWTSEAFDAIEVYNGGSRFDPWDAQGVEAWEERVGEGRAIVPVGGSDCHRWGTEPPGELLHPALGWPTTRVHVRGEELPLEALASGRVVIEEPGTRLELVATGRREAVGPGEAIEGPVVLRVSAEAEEGGLLLQVKRIAGEVVGEQELAGSASFEVELDEGSFYARVWPADPDFVAMQGGVALTAAVRVD